MGKMGKVEAAKQDGSWYALDNIEALEIPPDLAQALTANEKAKQYFAPHATRWWVMWGIRRRVIIALRCPSYLNLPYHGGINEKPKENLIDNS
jgi:hypothetical protein